MAFSVAARVRGGAGKEFQCICLAGHGIERSRDGRARRAGDGGGDDWEILNAIGAGVRVAHVVERNAVAGGITGSIHFDSQADISVAVVRRAAEIRIDGIARDSGRGTPAKDEDAVERIKGDGVAHSGSGAPIRQLLTLSMNTPLPVFPSGPVPAAFVPMRLACTVVPEPLT